MSGETGLEVAVIGMTVRFPGAKNIDQFWQNLKNGVESITFFAEEELLAERIAPEQLHNPEYVKCGGGLLEDKEYFDAAFFGYSAIEAGMMDPQLRIFHECAWHALENAGYDPFSYDGLIGLYAGASFNLFWEAAALLSGRVDVLGGLAAGLLIDRDYLCTRVSYTLNLKGPSVVVKTACSTSLVAVHMACQAILNGECDIALAGGVTIVQVNKAGYLYMEDMIASPDGHCRVFDARAKGTLPGDGLGIVVLKRLQDAIDDGDTISAVIKSTAINNDGIRKAGYTAPSITGQCEVIQDALQLAEVDPETVSYVETHGTGTVVGDPIEIEALKKAFDTNKRKFCAIGSVKSNVGHLDSAAGVAGLIKTILALKHKLIPPSLHFETPNPKIDFENSPFYVNNRLLEWKSNGHPLRAGVSSFGIGGTNAHVVLEEWPEAQNAGHKAQSEESRAHRLILLSAKTKTALERMSENLAIHLKENPGINLADAAYTLQVGRRAFPHRRMVVCATVNEAIEALSTTDSGKTRSSYTKDEKKSPIFMFAGLGSQYVNMGLGLYREVPYFREEMDRCFAILKPLLEYDIKQILYPSSVSSVSSVAKNKDINQPEIAQVVVFIFEYALAKLLMQWGIKPHAMIGYSLGEYTAACIAGVFPLEDALKLLITRGRLISGIPTGTMLSVPLPAQQLKPYLTAELTIAIDNGPSCIIAGAEKALHDFQGQLKEKRYLCMRLSNSHAIHSKMMDPILKEFENNFSHVKLNKPQIPYVSNVTGQWITVREAVTPAYWSQHMRETVRFADGIKQLLKEPNPIFIEIGPGRDLSTLLVRHKGDNPGGSEPRAVNLIRAHQQEVADDIYLLRKIGQLWLYDLKIDWQEFYAGEKPYRLPLPLYPFAGQRFWFEGNPLREGRERMGAQTLSRKKADPADWFYIPQWNRSSLHPAGETGISAHPGRWLVFMGESPLGARLVQQLKKDNHHVTIVRPGTAFAQVNGDEYTINPGKDSDYEKMFQQLLHRDIVPANIVHLWNLTGNHREKITLEELERTQDLGLYSLLNIARAIGSSGILNELQLGVITDNMQPVTGEENLCPEKATILGPIKVIPLEYPNIRCLSIDVIDPGPDTGKADFIVGSLLKEFAADFADYRAVAYRRTYRWIESFEPIPLNPIPRKIPRLKKQGVYLVTGGFGGMGFALAEHLVKELQAKLILVDILEYPGQEKPGQDKWLVSNDRKSNINLKKQKISQWEKNSAQIQIYDADVSNYEQMKQVISKAKDHFGKINGVIHTAGFIDYAGVIQRRTRQMTEELLAAKVKGTLVLEELLKHEPLDFMVLFSSVGNLFYKIKFGQVGYNAGHEFLDVFAYKKQREGKFTVTIDWNDWLEVGMAVRAANQGNSGTGNTPGSHGSSIEDILGISPSEGIDVIQRIIANDFCRVIISTRDLRGMMEFMNRPVEEPAGMPTPAEGKEGNNVLLARPELSTPYTAPSNETQQTIVNIWQKFFGIEKIGIHDDFFELGGDSLMATQMVFLVHRELQVRIALMDVFNLPTIEKLAGYIESKERDEFAVIDESLVLLKEGSAEAGHFFFIHDGTGEVDVYIDFCSRLKQDFNFWGIKADRIENLTPQNFTVQEIAENYVKKIQSLQANGPYYIAGFSFGGKIAFETVRHLEQLKEPVKLLAVIDVAAPETDLDSQGFEFTLESESAWILKFVPHNELKEKITNVSGLNRLWSFIVDYLEESGIDIKTIKQVLPPNMPRAIPNFDQLSLRQLIFHWNMIRSLERAENCYFPPGKSHSPTVVFESQQPLSISHAHWDEYCSRSVKTFKISGDHFSIFRTPYVEAFAETFDSALQETK